MRVCVFTCPSPLRQPSLRSPLSPPSPASHLLQPPSLPALSLPPPSLLKTREAPEDRLGQAAELIPVQHDLTHSEASEDSLGQVAQQIVVQIEAHKVWSVCEAPDDRLGQVAQPIAVQTEVTAGSHVVENAISQCLDTLVVEVQCSRLVGAGACAVQDAAVVCGKAAGAEGARQTSFRTTFGTICCEEQGEKRHNQERWLRRSAAPLKPPLLCCTDDPVCVCVMVCVCVCVLK